MSKLMLTKGFRTMEVGPAQLVKIKKVSYDDKFGIIRMTFVDENGATLNEKFKLYIDDDKPNEVVFNIFSTIAKAATGDYREREIDPLDLQGLYLIADVIEQKSDDGKTYTHLRNYKFADPDEVEFFDTDNDDEDEESEDEEVEEEAEEDDDLFD